MPIKYNLTKFDKLAEEFHDLAQIKNPSLNNDEKISQAQAVIVASFSPSHSWQTSKLISEGPASQILTSPYVKEEFLQAKKERWKRVMPPHIQEVARMNVKDNVFNIWLVANLQNGERVTYRNAWACLKKQFEQECDGITASQR